MKSFTTYLALLATSAQAGIIYDRCPERQVMQNFELDRYLGTWRTIAYDKDANYKQEDAVCTSAVYSRRDDGSIRARNNAYHEYRGEWDGVTGTLSEANPGKNEGALLVQF